MKFFCLAIFATKCNDWRIDFTLYNTSTNQACMVQGLKDHADEEETIKMKEYWSMTSQVCNSHQRSLMKGKLMEFVGPNGKCLLRNGTEEFPSDTKDPVNPAKTSLSKEKLQEIDILYTPCLLSAPVVVQQQPPELSRAQQRKQASDDRLEKKRKADLETEAEAQAKLNEEAENKVKAMLDTKHADFSALLVKTPRKMSTTKLAM